MRCLISEKNFVFHILSDHAKKLRRLKKEILRIQTWNNVEYKIGTRFNLKTGAKIEIIFEKQSHITSLGIILWVLPYDGDRGQGSMYNLLAAIENITKESFYRT